MSKKKTYSAPEKHAPAVGSDTARMAKEVASYYSEDMSKEAVGALFKGYEDDDTAYPEAEKPSEKSGKTGKTPSIGSAEDVDYIEYMNSYSRFDTAKTKKSGVTEEEKEKLGSHTPRKTSVTLSSRADSTTATIYHKKSGESADKDSFYETKRTSYADGSLLDTVISNIRYIVILGVAVLLIIIAALAINLSSANHKLSLANKKIEEQEKESKQYNALQIEVDNLAGKLSQAETENEDLKAQLSTYTSSASGTNTAGSDTQTTPPPSGAGTTTNPPSSPTGSTKYTVQEKDTLWSIAAKVYGDGSLWEKIGNANGLKDGSTLKIGMELVIPPK